MKILAVLAALGMAFAQQAPRKDRTLGYDDTPVIPGQKWRVHDNTRPHPRVIAPGSENAQPPSDAIVLFDGKDLSQWAERAKGQLHDARWKTENGYMEVVPGTGSILTREKFGDCQFHIEWSEPPDVHGKSQSRGNSGVMFMTRYEIQVLDSYQDLTYADGQAAAIYGQWPPLVNAMRKPGEWQTYDVVFEAPRFNGERLASPVYVTLFHNGVLMHHHKEFIGNNPHARNGTYVAHPPEEPLMLQNHGSPVRFRNIWIRRLNGYDTP